MYAKKICIYCAYLFLTRKPEIRCTSPLGAPTKAERISPDPSSHLLNWVPLPVPDKLLKSLRTRRHILLSNLHTHITVMPRLKTNNRSPTDDRQGSAKYIRNAEHSSPTTDQPAYRGNTPPDGNPQEKQNQSPNPSDAPNSRDEPTTDPPPADRSPETQY